MLSDLRFRLRAIFNRRAMEQELHEELSAHLERETEKYVRQGMSRDEAARRARVAFGGVDRIKDDTRDARGTTLLDTIAQDTRYAWRGLRSKPGFTAAVVIALALGIGANTAMFGIVDRLLFRSPAYLSDIERVHRVFAQYVWNGETRTEGSHSYLRFTELASTPALELAAAIDERQLDVGRGSDAQMMNVAPVSATLFDFFSVRPAIGRFFTRDEDKPPAGTQVAVLGYDFWQSGFAGRADVLGQVLYVGAIAHTVVGVAPRGFAAFSEGSAPAVYVPITAFAYGIERGYSGHHGWTWLNIVVRRRSDVSALAAASGLTTVYQRSWDLERETGGNTRWPTASQARARVMASPVHTARGPDARADSKVATWVMGVAVVVLLVACANVANLLLGRAVARRRETALRLALGVSTRRLLQQLLTESLLLATLGGVAGLLIANWGGRVLGALFLPGANIPVASDARTIVFGAAATLVVALLTGVAPVVAVLRSDVAGSLKAGVREGTYRRSRMRTGLLLFQGALSVVLLVGAGLFVRSLTNVRSLRLGYDPDSVVALDFRIRGVRLTGAERDALGARLLSAAAATPGVRSATLAASVPFGGNEGRGFPSFPGADTARIRRGLRYVIQAGMPQYFETVGTRILRGRGIAATDRANTQPIVVVNQAMAERLWPGEDALGKQMRVGEQTNPMMTVVGIAENSRGLRIDGELENWYYVSWEQYRAIFDGQLASLLVRVNGRAEDYVSVLQRRLLPELPGAPLMRAASLRERVAPRLRSWEFGAKMFVAFGALALGLAAIGLYSVIAYAVAQRSHEFGVRMALGASVGDVMRTVVGQGVTFAVAGIAIGSVISLWAGKWVEPLLFDQSARDPLVFAVVGGVLLVAALAATLGPAWRAMRVNPTVALRSD